MSMLGRYKKVGGFIQLLKLIESCEDSKQDNFLQMVEAEDLQWAKAIKAKMLTMDRIFSWEDDQILAKIAGQIPEDVIASLMHTYKIPISERILPSFSDTQKERIQGMVEKGEPTEKELMRAVGTFISEVRRCLQEGYVPVEKIDRGLNIPADIEEQLAKGEFKIMVEPNQADSVTSLRRAPSAPGVAALMRKNDKPAAVEEPEKPAANLSPEEEQEVQELRAEVKDLREKLSTFAYQNHRLRRELKVLQERINKKISS